MTHDHALTRWHGLLSRVLLHLSIMWAPKVSWQCRMVLQRHSNPLHCDAQSLQSAGM